MSAGISDIAEGLGVTRTAAHRHLSRLVTAGRIISTGSGRSVVYSVKGS